MANPNLLTATSIYGKNASATGTGSEIVVLTCPTDKLIKITSINVHRDGAGGGTSCTVKIAGAEVAGTTAPSDNANYTLGSFYLTESQQVVFNAGTSYEILISYEEIDDA